MPWLMVGTLSHVSYRYEHWISATALTPAGELKPNTLYLYGNFRLRCPANSAARVLNLHTHLF